MIDRELTEEQNNELNQLIEETKKENRILESEKSLCGN